MGSVASLGPRGLELQARFAQRLGLKAPAISWTNSRDVYAEWGNLLTLLSGTADRIGHEVYNLQRSEIAELREIRRGTRDVALDFEYERCHQALPREIVP